MRQVQTSDPIQPQLENQLSAQLRRIYGSNPTALLAVLWASLMLFWVVCGNVALAASEVGDFDRAALHERQLEYYLSKAEPLASVSSLLVEKPTEQALQSSSIASSIASSIESDIRISESVAPGRFWQSNPAVCILTDGSTIVAFEDERQGSKKIYLQKYNSFGAAVGANLLIAGRNDGHDLLEPIVVTTVSNKFYLGYRDVASGQVRVARLNSDMTVDLSDFAASAGDNGAGALVYAGPFALAARLNGEFAIAYESYSATNTIALRSFSPTGALIGVTQTVNSDGTIASHWAPDLAFDESGGLGVVWEDYRSGTADIFLRRYDSLGIALGNEINLVDASAQAVGQFLPSLVFSGIHGFVTGWSDSRDSWTVYIQRFSKQPGIGLVGANLAITPTDVLTSYLDVDLAVGSDGIVSATYCGYGASSDALLQRFTAGLALDGNPVSLASELFDQPLKPAVVIDGHHALVWQMLTSGDKDIQLTLLDPNLAPMIPEPVLVHDDATGAVSDQPEVAVVGGRAVVTVFRDLRRDGGDIYVQSSNLEGNLGGANRLLNQDNAGGLQSQPSISANVLAYIVAWNDQRFIGGVSSSRIYVRYGAGDGSAISAEALVSGDSPAASSGAKANPSVALAPNGSAMVSWLDMRTGSPQVFARSLDDNQTPVGSEFQLSNTSQGAGNSKPIIAVDGGNIFTIGWRNTSALAEPLINVRRYNSAKILLGSFQFTADQPNYTITDFDLEVDNSGKVFLLWQGTDIAGGLSLFLTAFTNGGAKIGSTIEVTDNPAAAPAEPSLSVDEFANMLMAWVDSRGPERRIYTQNINSDFTPAGGNQPLSLAAAPAMSAPSALAISGRSWVGWADARNEGMNVYLQGFVHFPTDVKEGDKPLLPNQFALQQNFPNPFNPTTHISFTLPKRAKLTLNIYNILGQEIRQLAQGDFTSGEHQILWDGADNNGSSVASGIYFYRLKTAGFTQTRKMTLLK